MGVIETKSQVPHKKVASIPTKKPPYFPFCANKTFLHITDARDGIDEMVLSEVYGTYTGTRKR